MPRASARTSAVSQSERVVLGAGAFALTTFFALLYALRGGIAALDRGETIVWSDQIVLSLAVWWTCLPLLPLLAWLVRVAPLNGAHLLRNAAMLLGGTLVAAIARHYLLTPVVTWVTRTPDTPASAVARTLTYFTTFLVIVGLLHAAHFYRGLRVRELEAERMARSLAEARVVALRTQLQPHFVFNVLNGIAALLHTDPMTADRMLTRFATLLRSVLQAGVSEEHPLRDEVAMLRQYVDLMQLRFGERLVVDWDIDAGVLDTRVPWMVFQPLVENALEHGFSDRIEPGHLRIAARADGGSAELVVEDDGAGLAANAVHVDGVGLGNTRQRLAELYGDRGRVTLETRPGGGVRAVVNLPLVAVTR